MNVPSATERRFVVATPGRSVCDNNARALEHRGLLRFLALGTRHGAPGIPPERTRLNPAIGLTAYVAARLFSTDRAEAIRFRLHPWFDRWVLKQLQPGDNIISSYGYTNASFRWIREHGGKTFLDAGNSHPENFWNILTEEHRRWNCSAPPVPRNHYERSLAMMNHVDYVLSPSNFVSQSFLERGFKPEQILRNVYPVDLSCFSPDPNPRPKDRPLTIINTGTLSLRKGSPYLLEAFRLIHQHHPSARFLLTRSFRDEMKPILTGYSDLPIDWSPPLAHPQLAERLRSADIFVLPSLEEGLVRTALEAMACGLPIVVTPNTGANDFVAADVSGTVVPVRNPQSIVEAVLMWAERVVKRGSEAKALQVDLQSFNFKVFEKEFFRQLSETGIN